MYVDGTVWVTGVGVLQLIEDMGCGDGVGIGVGTSVGVGVGVGVGLGGVGGGTVAGEGGRSGGVGAQVGDGEGAVEPPPPPEGAPAPADALALRRVVRSWVRRASSALRASMFGVEVVLMQLIAALVLGPTCPYPADELLATTPFCICQLPTAALVRGPKLPVIAPV